MRPIRIVGVMIGLLAFAYAGSVLQRTTTDLFASPDETAVMMFARAWSPGEGFRLPLGLSETVAYLPGLHPRSIVRQGDVLVPVGFLGMPFLAGIAERLWHGLGAYLTLILVLSAVYPLWRLAFSLGDAEGDKERSRIATMTVVIFLAFPTVLLYVNRGLFPNLPVVALAIWGVYGMYKLGDIECLKNCRLQITNCKLLKAILTGLALGLAFMIRPLEAVWIVPWVLWAGWIGTRGEKDRNWKRFVPHIIAGIVVLAVCSYGVLLSMQTYPGHEHLTSQPVAGYFLKDTTGVYSGGTGEVMEDVSATPSVFILPFGFHPRVMWENVRVFLFGSLGIWVGTALFGAFVVLRKRWNRDAFVFLGITGWTVAVLLLFYGQALYTDNINGGVTLGNSFLRYTLPLVPLIAYGCARLIEHIRSAGIRGRILAGGAMVFFVLFGFAFAFTRDEEGVVRTRYELERYALIRATAERVVGDGSAIVLSERSDKIFASGPFVAVSPLPNDEDFEALLTQTNNVYFFHRTFDGDEMEERIRSLVGEPEAIFTLNNETFYRLR